MTIRQRQIDAAARRLAKAEEKLAAAQTVFEEAQQEYAELILFRGLADRENLVTKLLHIRRAPGNG